MCTSQPRFEHREVEEDEDYGDVFAIPKRRCKGEACGHCFLRMSNSGDYCEMCQRRMLAKNKAGFLDYGNARMKGPARARVCSCGNRISAKSAFKACRECIEAGRTS